jgi:hypothetical protein
MYIGLSALSLTMSFSLGFLKRRTFLNEYFLRKQLLNLGSVLFDLVPPLYGLQERQKNKSVCALISVIFPIGLDEERSSKASLRVSVCVCVMV